MVKNGFSVEWLDELKSKNNIVDVLSKYIKLDRKGNRYWACCPFHGEKTPSFTVSEDKGIYHCFGCGESGDVIKFVQQYENIDFLSAVRMLAGNVGMQLPTFEMSEDSRKKKELRDRLYQICDIATTFYQDNLSNPQSKPYTDYIKKRNLSSDAIKTFRIGASLNYYDLVKVLRSKHFSEEDMLQSGVVGKSEDGNLYDFYGKRVVYPIINSFGDVIAFSARTIDDSGKVAKYKNTYQTTIFTKGQVLYSLNNIRELKKARELDFIILVEGQMDAIACYSIGLKNTVATMGTALTLNHADDLYRLCDKIVLCMDQDSAGREATLKAIDVLKQKSFDIKVASYENQKDPDDYIKKNGTQAFINVIANSLPANDYIIKNIIKKYDLSKNESLTKCVKELVKFLQTFNSSAEQEIYINMVSKLTNISTQVLKNDINKTSTSIKKSEEVILPNNIENSNKSEIYILAYYLHNPELDITEADLDDFFQNENILKNLYEFLKQKAVENKKIIISQLFDYFEIKSGSPIDKIINYEMPEDPQEYYKDCYYQLKIENLQKKSKEIEKSIENMIDINEINLAILTKLDIDKKISEYNLIFKR